MRSHYELMKTTLSHAEEALGSNEVPISALLFHVKSQKILLKAHNHTNESLNGTSHAEFHLYNELKTLYPDNHLKLWNECILYVTVEPCIMCASLLDQLNIKMVVFGCANDRFGGNGSVFKIQRNYKACPGVLNHQSISLLRKFYIQENEQSPTAIGKKKRVLKLDEFPVLDYKMYISLKEFQDIWGEEFAWVWETNEPLVFDEDGTLTNTKSDLNKKHLIDDRNVIVDVENIKKKTKRTESY